MRYPDFAFRCFLVAMAAFALAAVAMPPFRHRCRSAPIRACFANQKTLAGAVEMYNLDFNTEVTRLDPPMRTELVKQGYLQVYPTDPSVGPGSEGNYVLTPKHGNRILCLRHGPIFRPEDSPPGETPAEYLARIGVDPGRVAVGPPAGSRRKRGFLGSSRTLELMVRDARQFTFLSSVATLAVSLVALVTVLSLEVLLLLTCGRAGSSAVTWVVATATAGRCPVCGDGLVTGESIHRCGACETPHHAGCAAYLGGCATFACAAGPPPAGAGKG